MPGQLDLDLPYEQHTFTQGKDKCEMAVRVKARKVLPSKVILQSAP